MEVEVISSADNKLFDRKEVKAVVRFDGATPNRNDIRQAVATKLGLNPDMTVLNSVENAFGEKEIKVVAHSYNKMEKLMEVEPEYIRKRDGVGIEKEKPKEGEAPAEKPAEAPKEEKPKEEKKEPEKKEEPKKEEAPKEEKPPEKKEEKKPEPEKKEEPKEEKKEEAKSKEEKKEGE